eukprot:1194572-Prorocentrum_minimum.AAC.3
MQDEADMRQIKLAWRPPANSKARISCYKVRGLKARWLDWFVSSLVRGQLLISNASRLSSIADS